MIYHILTKEAWQTAVSQNEYAPPSLEEEGFIHCSTNEQILIPANQLYRGQRDLLLLQIVPEKVVHPIVYEDCYETGQEFPHVYGPLNLDAVVKTIPFPCKEDGSFDLPTAVTG